jgi:PTS system nitrogen regulatory IIA component
MDGRPTHIFFLLLTPENSAGVHLKLLARISRLLKNDTFKEQLMAANFPDDIISAIREEDEEF